MIYGKTNVRTVTIDGATHFCLYDVSKAINEPLKDLRNKLALDEWWDYYDFDNKNRVTVNLVGLEHIVDDADFISVVKRFLSPKAKVELSTITEQTMSSLEIAELTGKLHKNVLVDIRNVLKQAKIDALKFQRIYFDSMNRSKICYNLPRFECDLVISGYSVPYRAAIIRRWHELEKIVLQSFQLPATMSEALRDLANLYEEKEALLLENSEQAKKITQDKPKVEFVDSVIDSLNSYSLNHVAKTLGFGRNKLMVLLRRDCYLTLDNLPFQKHVDKGWFTVTTAVVKGVQYYTCKVLGKGLYELHSIYGSGPNKDVEVKKDTLEDKRVKSSKAIQKHLH